MSRDQAGCTQEPGCPGGAAEVRSALRFGFNDSAIRFLIFLIDVNLSGSARRSDGAKVFTNDKKRIVRCEAHGGTVVKLGGTYQVRGLEHIVWILRGRKRSSEQMYRSDASLRRPARLVGSGSAGAYSDCAGC